MSGIVVDLILFFILVGNAILGYKRGLVRVIFNICSSLIAIVLVLILYVPITNYIINKTQISQKLENVFEQKIAVLFEEDSIETAEQLQQNSSMISIFKIFADVEEGSLIEETTDNITKYLSTQISHKILSVLVFFGLFVGIRLVLFVLRNYVELIANLPVIKLFNQSGGMIYGVIKGFLVIYIVLAVLSLLLPSIQDTIVITAIQKAPIGSKMFNHNIILNLIFKFL